MTSPLFNATNNQSQPQATTTATPGIRSFATLQAEPVVENTALAVVTSSAPVVVDKEQTLVALRNTIPDNYIANVGKAHATKIGAISEQVLGQVKASDMGEFGKQFGEIIKLTKNIRPDDFKQKGFLGRIKGWVSNAREELLQEFNTVSAQMDRLVAGLDSHMKTHEASQEALKRLYDANYAEYLALDQEIKQTQEVIVERNRQLETIDASLLNPMEVQILADERNKVARLQQRVHELTASLRVAEQTAPEIKQLQTNASRLVDKFAIAQTVGIPIWKKQFSLAIMQLGQEKSVEVIQEFETSMNEMMVRNAQNLKTTSVEIAKQTASTMIKADTVEQVNAHLIELLTETKNILDESEKENQESAKRMLASNAKLREAIQNN